MTLGCQKFTHKKKKSDKELANKPSQFFTDSNETATGKKEKENGKHLTSSIAFERRRLTIPQPGIEAPHFEQTGRASLRLSGERNNRRRRRTKEAPNTATTTNVADGLGMRRKAEAPSASPSWRWGGASQQGRAPEMIWLTPDPPPPAQQPPDISPRS